MTQEVVIIIRPSFKRFCGQDICRAALFNQFLFWIAWKAKEQPADKVKSGEVYWYGSAEEICVGLDDSWSVNKIRKEIKDLVNAGLIGQRHNPNKGWDQTRHYFFGEEQGKVLKAMCKEHNVCLLHLGLTPSVLHLLNLVNAFDINGKCNCQISEMDLPNKADASTKSGNAIPKVTTKVPSKDTDKERRPSILSSNKKKKGRVSWYVQNNMKECSDTLNNGLQDKAYLERAQQIYDDSGIDDNVLFKQKIDQAVQNTQIYAWDRSNEEKMAYFFKYLEKSLNLRNEKVAQ